MRVHSFGMTLSDTSQPTIQELMIQKRNKATKNFISSPCKKGLHENCASRKCTCNCKHGLVEEDK